MNYKRIAMISYHTCPLASFEGKETGGMNVYVLELSKHLVKKGFIVDVFTRSQDKKQIKVVEVLPNLRVIHLTDGSERPIHKKKLINYVPEFVHQLKLFINSERMSYDVIHSHYYLSGLIGLDIKNSLFPTSALIINFHTLALMKNLVARNEYEKENPKRIKAELMLVQKADKIISTSESDRQYLIYLYNSKPDKITVIPPGINIDFFKPIDKNKAKVFIKANPNHKILLFAGRIEPLKGIDTILYAMKILLERNPKLKVCFWIVGGDTRQPRKSWSKELQKLEELRKLLNISTIVKFVGQRPQNELPFYYSASEILVMPSHYESFGMVALEAMSCGTPVITTNVTGISSLFDKKHSTLITTANNPLLLAQQIENLLTNEKIYKQLSMDIYKKVQDLTWENIAQEMINTYNQ
ncbi:MAG: glycosyltransferase [Patescibacteria group bacterium]|nr:glycosyltransferase [Patescibacteria group bacterium]